MKTMHAITRRNCLALGAGAAAACFASSARAAVPTNVVVELFSSQGCSSCPPGDRLLTELKAAPGVLALTYHVDYWDYLGWKDTLANAEFSQRQYDYAKARGDMDVYTPQMIVNGEKAMVGSQRSEIMAVLGQSRRAPWPVDVAISDGVHEIIIDLGANAGPGEATLWVMPIIDHVAVRIDKGELSGQEITYQNVVRKLVPAGMWSGKAQRIVLPKDGLMPAEATACVALLQKNKIGPVLGCASWGSVTS